MSLSRARNAVLLALVLLVLPAPAQKRPLAHADYDSWRSIAGPALSRDGRWLAYSFMPQDGDGELVLRDLRSNRESRHSAGALPPPPIPEPGSDTPPTPRGIRVQFTSDNQFLIATTYPSKSETEAARKAKKKPAEMPKTGALILNLATGEATRVDNVKAFQVPEKGGPWAAFHKHSASPEPPASGAGATSRPPAASDLLLRHLPTARDRSFPDTSAFGFTRDALLWFTVSAKNQDLNGLFVLNASLDAEPAPLLKGKGKYDKITWDRRQSQLAFVSTREDAEAKTPAWKLYHWRRAAPATPASALAIAAPAGLAVSDKGALSFARSGDRLIVPLARAPKPAPEKKEESPANEKVNLDLWHYRDDLIQPMQRIRANQERNRTYRGVYHFDTAAFTPVASPEMPGMSADDSGLRAFGLDDRAYRRSIDYDTTYADIYVVDTRTGARRKAIEKLRGSSLVSPVTFSPDGQWGLFFNNGHWHALNTSSLEIRNLTSTLNVSFANEDDDTPAPPGSYGHAGWARDSSSVLLNDKFDIWRIFPDGRPAVNLTAGEGRKAQVQYRVARIEAPDEDDEDEDRRYLDPAKPLYFRAESHLTRESGFVQGAWSAAPPRRLLWGAKNFAFATRAREADVLVVRAERFDEYPDLHVTDLSFRKLAKVTSGGEQTKPFLWGRSELMNFTSTDGVPLQANLIKPENFDPKKKYPLMVYIYERMSQGVHRFVNPAPGTSINSAFYVSNGYIILQPDIVYTTGQPGQSALHCVLPAIQALVNQGFIDEARIGIQGHSWGGYQIAWMITQTNRFRAAEAGAPVGNMTSAYSGIRWGSGMPRQFQYEKTQSRIGLPLIDAPHKYLENSPIFHANRVKTPLLMVHNDQDDAVPWYQGIEIYLALRRLDKEVYLLNYNGEFHGLRRRQNQKDWTIRMQQFFDHHLKDAPKPEWMERGVPFIERDEEKERFLKSLETDQPIPR
ncbi:MAG: prolyl oligopeptidase family serine peptidase [Bryobacteraceae bacterium]|nr:S9 family peptidase [Solibacteraceae bacterium]MCO5350383.1 prolyl oligopeptidase family serine peptidase [Bryobacteraceae bacterium]